MKKRNRAAGHTVSVSPAMEAENMFNRTSGRVHGYSSWVKRYLRLSIGFRASLGYAALLWRMIVPIAFLFTCVYGIMQAPNYAARQQEALAALPTPQVEGAQANFLAAGQEPEGLLIYEGWGIHWETDPFVLSVQYVAPYGTAGRQVQLLFSLREDLRVLGGLMIGIVLMLLYASFNFMTRGKRVNTKLLQPINEIATTAQQMSEKNLSARINVAGTQNELRDLAVVINDMLTRIEVAYNRQKQFVSDASHELRTPIAVIQGYANLLERWGKDNPDVRDEAIEAITSETQSMKELVENLLFLARHDKNTFKLSVEAYDSAEMLHELIKDTTLIAKEHNILAGEIAEEVLVGDRSMIKQAVRVFVDNAVKYTPPGGSIEISSLRKKDALFITIADSGPGIKKADLARIFDRFYRSDEARNSQTGGHGLGLAIARIIAASHGGRIHARSQPGVGSAFTLEIPIQVQSTQAQSAPQPEQQNAS